jgi:hypothetical protein
MGKPEQTTLAVARSIYRVPVTEIDATGGLRPLDLGWVEGLAALIKRDGLKHPIEIYAKAGGGYGVIAGRHRLAAMKSLGLEFIEADLQSAGELARRAGEVAENLFRMGLSPLDRAAFVAEQIAIEKARAGIDPNATPQSVAAQARWSDRVQAEADDATEIFAAAYGWTAAVAEIVGLSPRSIRLDLELHRGLKPEVAEALRGLPVGKNASQLRALAKMPEGDQRQVAGLIVEGQATGVTEAQAILKQAPVKTAEQKAFSAVVGNWARLSPAQQKDLLRTKLTLPKGVTLMIDGEAVDA